MGTDLSGAGGSFRFSAFAWHQVIQLGRLHGWNPAGTEAAEWDEPGATPERLRAMAEDRAAWTGGYDTNDHQWVTDADARNLAAALERALPDVPGFDALGDKAGAEAGTVEVEARVSALECFSGPAGRRQLREFIAFCRAGGFCIG